LKKPKATGWLQHILIILALYSLTACALFGGGEEDPVKNLNVKLTAPPNPYEEIKVSSADHVWQSLKTGNTIALNSSCVERNKEDLHSLEKGIFSGVENIVIKKETKITVDGAPAVRTYAEGKTDNIPISIDLVVIEKNNCTYDLAYVARTATFPNERTLFDNFVERFHSP
jgi:hypothetical protein